MAETWDDDTERKRHFERIAGISAVVSFIGWWSILAIGILIAHG